jgi:MFS family permease
MARAPKSNEEPSDSAARWVAWLFWGFCGWTLLYADRAVLSPSLAAIGRTFSVGPAALGLIATSFFAAYTAIQIPVGVWSDRINPGWLVGLGTIGFGLFTAAMGASPTYSMLLAASVLAGAFQGAFYPAQFAIASRTIPQAYRTFATSIINSGMGAGIALGYVIGSVIHPSGFAGEAWRIPFLVLGGITAGFGMAIVRPGVVRGRHPAGSRALSTPLKPRERQILRRFSLLNFASLFGFFFMLTWLPYYLATAVGLRPLTAGLIPAALALVAVGAALAWSRLADLPGRRSRWIPRLFAMAALGLVVVAAGGAHRWLWLPGLILYGLVGKLVMDPLLVAELSVHVRPEAYGRAFGVLNFSGMLASVVAPEVAGLLLQLRLPMQDNFWLAAGLLAAAAGLAARPLPLPESVEEDKIRPDLEGAHSLPAATGADSAPEIASERRNDHARSDSADLVGQ